LRRPTPNSGRLSRDRMKRKLGIPRSWAAAVPRLFAGVLGAATLGAGAVAVFATKNANGSAALIAAGAVLCLVAMVGEGGLIRGPGGWEVRWPEKRRELLDDADAADAAGNKKAAKELRSQAEQLNVLGPLAERYAKARRQPPGPQRTRQLSSIVQEAIEHAEQLDLDREAVANLFHAGDDGFRIFALALIQRKPDLADPPMLQEAIDRPRSAFELWQALLAARAAVLGDGFPPDADLGPLRESLQQAATSSLFEPHNRELAREILRLLESRRTP
jgi:hypothetical protein